MAKGKGKKQSKSDVPVEVEQRLLSLSPQDLATELAFEENAIEALKTQKKNDGQIKDLAEEVADYEKIINGKDDVIEAKEAYDNAKAEHSTAEYVDVKADLAALRKGYGDDIKNRSKVLKYMRKMAKRHIESGALKRKI